MRKWLPIRKVAVAAVGGGLTWGALRLGADLGSDAANQAATVLVGLVFAYVEKDPRVSHVLDDAEDVIERSSWDAKHSEVITGTHTGPCGPECTKP